MIGLLIDPWIGARASVVLHINVNECAVQIQLIIVKMIKFNERHMH